MSEEGNENEEIIDAQSEDNNSEEPEEPWQMQILHELLTLGSVEDYTVSELQHVVSTHSALKQVLPSFYEAYENTFQGIHDQQVSWANSRGLKPITVEYSCSTNLQLQLQLALGTHSILIYTIALTNTS